MLEPNQIIEWLAPLLNSNFVTSLVGAGAGAWAGAYAAQRIAARANDRGELLIEIRHMIAAFNLAVTIFNVCLGLKRQHIKPLKETYDQKRRELLEKAHKCGPGESGAVSSFEFVADFQTLPQY